MPHCKNTIKTEEVGTFFKKSTKEAMRVIYEVIKATKVRGVVCAASASRRMPVASFKRADCRSHRCPVTVQHPVGGQTLRELRNLGRSVPRNRGRCDRIDHQRANLYIHLPNYKRVGRFHWTGRRKTDVKIDC